VDRRKADNPNDPDRDFILRLYQYFPKEGTLESLGSLYTAIIDKLDELKNNLPDGLRYLAPELPDWAVRLEGIKGNGVGAHFKFMRSLFMGTHPLLATKDKSIIWDTAAPESNDYPSLVVTRPPGSSKDYHAELNNLSAAQRLVLLANLHYWIVLGLLNMTYRHDDWSDPDPLEPPRYLALAQRHMRGPVLLLGLRLAEQEIGFPFDEFPEAFDWENQDHARSVIRQLVAKASLVAHKLMETGQLINSFKLHIYPITLSALV
jgi:hypothetical protein